MIGMKVVSGREPGCRLMVRSRGGCECWVSLVLISRILFSGLGSVVQLIFQVGCLRGKVLEHALRVGIFFVAWDSCCVCLFI